MFTAGVGGVMLCILLVLSVSFLILNVALFTVATVIVFIPNFWGFALALVGPPLFAAMLIGFFFLVAPNMSEAVELKTAFLACFIGFIFGIVGHLFIPDYIDLLGTQYVESVPVARASEHAGAGYRSYVEGELLASKAVHHVVHDTNSEGNPTQGAILFVRFGFNTDNN